MIKWRAKLETMPMVVPQAANGHYYHPRDNYRFNVASLYDSEKDAINAARKLRIDEIDRLQREVNALDQRYDDLEDAEMAAEHARLQQVMKQTDHLDSNNPNKED